MVVRAQIDVFDFPAKKLLLRQKHAWREIEKINLSSNYHLSPPIFKDILKKWISDEKVTDKVEK